MKFKINTTNKTYDGNRQTVYVVNEKPIVFHKRNELRQAMYYIREFGIDEHQNTEKLTKELLEHVLGRINFVLQINQKTLNS
jgi:RNA-directed DNA polymerase